MEDYTNKYKGEQVEVFGGEYQDGVLTAYCYVEDVVRTSSRTVTSCRPTSPRCTARAGATHRSHRPPRRRRRRRRRRRGRKGGAGRRLIVVRNVLKAWACLAVFAGLMGLAADARRLPVPPSFLGSAVLVAGAIYWYADRIVMGMVGARELAEARRRRCIRPWSGWRCRPR